MRYFKQKRRLTALFMIFALLTPLMSALPAAADEGYLWPVPAGTNVSQYYSSYHKAIDITGGGKIVATKSGTVEWVYTGCGNYSGALSSGDSCGASTCSPNCGTWHSSEYGKDFCNYGYGNGVVIKHSDGSGYSVYAHMASVSVKAGDKVAQGDTLGMMGSSGSSEGLHLHFQLASEVTVSSGYYNPISPINSSPATVISGGVNYIYDSEDSDDSENTVITENIAVAGSDYSFTTYPEGYIIGSSDATLTMSLTAGRSVISTGLALYDGEGELIVSRSADLDKAANKIDVVYDVQDFLRVSIIPDSVYYYSVTASLDNGDGSSEEISSALTRFKSSAESKTFTVFFNPTGGELDIDLKYVGYGSVYGELPVPTLSGYDFAGWSTEKEGEPDIGENMTVRLEDDIIVYAVWKLSAPKITAEPAASSVLTGGDAEFSITAEGIGLHYTWYKAGAETAVGEDSPALKLEKVTAADDGTEYYCKVYNESSSASSNTAALRVLDEEAYAFPFTDVSAEAWYYESVRDAARRGLVNGRTLSTFAPDANMTRAEAIKLAVCVHQIYSDGAVSAVESGEYWYSGYIKYAKFNGIAWDYQDYNAYVTREEFAHIFYGALPGGNYAAINNISNGVIPDVGDDGVYADEIYTLYRAGILIGSDAQGSFNPQSSIKRSEAAAILMRFIDESSRRTVTLG